MCQRAQLLVFAVLVAYTQCGRYLPMCLYKQSCRPSICLSFARQFAYCHTLWGHTTSKPVVPESDSCFLSLRRHLVTHIVGISFLGLPCRVCASGSWYWSCSLYFRFLSAICCLSFRFGIGMLFWLMASTFIFCFCLLFFFIPLFFFFYFGLRETNTFPCITLHWRWFTVFHNMPHGLNHIYVCNCIVVDPYEWVRGSEWEWVKVNGWVNN